jgi:hypothetical protein
MTGQAHGGAQADGVPTEPTAGRTRKELAVSDPKRLVEQVAAEADATAADPMPADAVPSRPNKSVTVATRVSPDDLAEIETLAGQLDVPVSALVRGWILAGLNARKGGSVRSAVERLSADVQRLRELVS